MVGKIILCFIFDMQSLDLLVASQKFSGDHKIDNIFILYLI